MSLPLAVHEARINFILEQYNLTDVADYIAAHDTGLPYHNAAHCRSVALRCFDLAMMAGTPVFFEQDEIVVLLCAALFHDFGHKGSTVTDSVNVETAKAAAVKYLTFNATREFYEDEVNAILELITVTEFPFIHDPQNLLQQIIRDADLMQCFDPDGISTIFDGLYQELEVKLGKLTPMQKYEAQMNFLRSATFFTEPGKAIMVAALPALDIEFKKAVDDAVECVDSPTGNHQVSCKLSPTGNHVDYRTPICSYCGLTGG